jgi:drug/metabolite transporter (DMT)-like permease
MKSDRALAYAAFATVSIVWGTTYLAIRVAVETIPPLLLTGIRFTVAGSLLLAVLLARGERIPRDRHALVNIAVVAFLLIGLGNFSVVWAEQWVPSGMAALLVGTAPFWAIAGEAMRTGGERVGLRRAFGMLIGFIGVALLVTPGGAGSAWDLHFLIGAAAIQVGSIAWQFGSVRSKYELKSVPPLMAATLQMLVGGILLIVAGTVAGEPARFHVNGRTLAALAYLTLIGSVVAYSAYVYALTKLRTTTVSLYAYINPVVAVILGWLILSERLTWVSITAMAVILAAMILVRTADRRAGAVTPAATEQEAA